MNIRYKKIILFVLISTMGIGIVTLSIAPNHSVNESMNNTGSKDADTIASITGEATSAVAPTAQGTTVTSSPTPSPAPLPVYDLEEDGYPEITKFIKDYYKAKINCDIDEYKKFFSDPSNISTEEQLKEDMQYYEKYKKIKCYVKKGYLEGTYIVFVYNEVKFINIDTSAPAVYQFYIITEEDGSLKIFSGEFDKVTEEYYYARTEDADVLELREKTDAKADKAKAKDADLKNFWDNLIKAQSSSDENSSNDSE